jgi:hypothetical protein
MSQNRSNVSLFEVGQDHVAIEKLLVLRIGLGARNHSGSSIGCKQSMSDYNTVKSDQQSFSQPRRHFTEHLACVTKKPHGSMLKTSKTWAFDPLT